MLAVAGGKGGSGKTTTALGLAGAYATRRRHPVVVDCDLDAPNLHLRAGVPRNPGLDADRPIETAHVSRSVPGVDVLSAGDADADDLDTALAALSAHSDSRPVLLDCPAGASEAATRPLRAADGAVIVATRGAEEIEDAIKSAAMARAVGTPVLAAVVSRVKRPPSGLESALGTTVVEGIPPTDNPLSSRQTTGTYARVVDAIQLDD